MLRLIFLLLFTLPAFGGLRAITGDVDDPLGSGCNGAMIITAPNYVSVGGVFKAATTRNILISDGTYTSFSLDSSQDATPAFSYVVEYRCGAAQPAPRCSWSIPAGSTSVTIVSIQTCPAASSTPSATVAYTAISGLTECAVPFGSASGAMTIDAANFCWDDTNNRIAIGTASWLGGTTEKFRVNNSSGSVSGNVTAGSGNNSANWALRSGGGGGSGDNTTLTLFLGNTGKWDIGMQNGLGHFKFMDADGGFAARLWIADTTGNVNVGGSETDNGYKLDVTNSGSSGTFRVYDQTATTGATKMFIKAGDSQTGGSCTDRLLSVLRPDDALGALIDCYGAYAVRDSSDNKKASLSADWSGASNSGFQMTSDAVFKAKSVTDLDDAGSYDIGLARNAAGVWEVNDGTVGAYRDLKLRTLKINPVAIASLPGSPAEGDIAFVNDSSDGSCVNNGGSIDLLCVYAGGAWIPAN